MTSVNLQPTQAPTTVIAPTRSAETARQAPEKPAGTAPSPVQDAVAAGRRGAASVVTDLVGLDEPGRPGPGKRLASTVSGWLHAAWSPMSGLFNREDKERVAFFGSSTTAGAGASRPDRRYSALVAQYMGWEEINAGKGGSLLSNYLANNPKIPPSALQRWQTAVADKHPDRIVLMYGANDMHNRVPMSVFKPAVGELLGDLKTVVPAEKLVVVTAQPVLKTAGDPKLYADALKEGAAAAGLKTVDPGRIISPADMPDYSHDHAHLNDQGHALLASYVAGQLTDMGWGKPVRESHGGNAVNGTVTPMAAGKMLVENANPLSSGELHRIEARFAVGGTAMVGVVRPNGTGGYDLMYRTDKTQVNSGVVDFDVPRWRVLEGDRLAVWTEGAAVGGQQTRDRDATLAVPVTGKIPLRDFRKGEAEQASMEIAIHTVDPAGK